jgi:hypothetical protein
MAIYLIKFLFLQIHSTWMLQMTYKFLINNLIIIILHKEIMCYLMKNKVISKLFYLDDQ